MFDRVVTFYETHVLFYYFIYRKYLGFKVRSKQSVFAAREEKVALIAAKFQKSQR